MDTPNTNVSPQTQEFAKLFGSYKATLIPWTDIDYVGVSILADYPDKGKFIPARNGKGEKDSAALIKIGYPVKQISDNKVTLSVEIHKVSKYSIGRFGYDFNDPSSPTKESLEKSKRSRQPIDLEDLSRYEYNISDKKFYDKNAKKYVEPEEIIQDIYSEHLKTLGNIKLRLGMSLQAKMIDLIDPSISALSKVNVILFGKRIKKSDNFSEGIFTAYSHKNLIDITLENEKIKILGSDLPISYQTAKTFIILISLLFLTNYYFHYDFLGFVALFNQSAKNSLFLTSLIALLLLIVDRGIPHLLLTLMNTLIRTRLYLMTMKIKA